MGKKRVKEELKCDPDPETTGTSRNRLIINFTTAEGFLFANLKTDCLKVKLKTLLKYNENHSSSLKIETSPVDISGAYLPSSLTSITIISPCGLRLAAKEEEWGRTQTLPSSCER